MVANDCKAITALRRSHRAEGETCATVASEALRNSRSSSLGIGLVSRGAVGVGVT